jgi:hypothetical protein
MGSDPHPLRWPRLIRPVNGQPRISMPILVKRQDGTSFIFDYRPSQTVPAPVPAKVEKKKPPKKKRYCWMHDIRTLHERGDPRNEWQALADACADELENGQHPILHLYASLLLRSLCGIDPQIERKYRMADDKQEQAALTSMEPMPTLADAIEQLGNTKGKKDPPG